MLGGYGLRGSCGCESHPFRCVGVESIRLDEEPSLNLGGAAGAWAFESPALRLQQREVEEATRLDEEPCSKHGTGASPWAFESPRFRSHKLWKDSQVVWQLRWKRSKPFGAMGVRLALLPLVP